MEQPEPNYIEWFLNYMSHRNTAGKADLQESLNLMINSLNDDSPNSSAVLEALNFAIKQEQSKNDFGIAFSFALLGATLMRIEVTKHQPTPEKLNSSLENLIKVARSQKESFIEKQLAQNYFKSRFNELAEQLWRDENFKHYRISEMADLLIARYQMEVKSLSNLQKAVLFNNHFSAEDKVDIDSFVATHDQFMKYFPSNPTTIKKWIKEVAPESAQKPGRKKKPT